MVFKRLQQLFFTHGQRTFFGNFPDIAKKREKVRRGLKKHNTPIFFIDREIVLNRFTALSQTLQSHWGNNFRIAYSFKTNYELAKSTLLKRQGVWAEVVSGHEYAMAKTLGYTGSQIIFNGPIKKDEELLRAFYDGALVHIDNNTELSRTIGITRSFKRTAFIGLRINATIPGFSKSRFGFSLENEEADNAIDQINKNPRLRLVSLHVHIGPDTDSLELYTETARQMVQFILSLSARTKFPIQYIDMGGGFPSGGVRPLGRASWNPLSVHEYIDTMSLIYRQAFAGNSKYPVIIVEPGRYFIDDATVYITKIYDVKHEDGRQQLLTDGAITMLPLRYYRPQIVKIFTPVFIEKKEQCMSTSIMGGTCREDDILVDGLFPASLVGDYVVYYCVGAYNQSMGSDFIFGKSKTVIF